MTNISKIPLDTITFKCVALSDFFSIAIKVKK